MVAQPEKLRFTPFGATDPLAQLGTSRQVQYLQRYFDDLDADLVVEEPQYFDRDYLSEFTAFYGTSCAGYENTCRRLHFFKKPITEEVFFDALGGEESKVEALQDAYLGFVVVRPMPAARLGRTVVRWYPEHTPNAPRVTSPSRLYSVCIAGLCLKIRGLAWQQQDSAVGACATIALWSTLHASGLQGHHAVPTTANVTRAANRNAPFGKRVFPSAGLNIYQLCEAIKAHGLSPVIIPGERNGSVQYFTRERFCASTSALIRSGFPVILSGSLDGLLHAVCAVGFRSVATGLVGQGTYEHEDRDMPNLYIHDDNLGPSVRFEIDSDAAGHVVLRPAAPTPLKPTTLPDPTTPWVDFKPDHILAAVPEDIRTSPDALHKKGMAIAARLTFLLGALAAGQGIALSGISFSTRFSLLREYMSGGLASILKAQPDLIRKVRRALAEEVRPMSLYLGVVRLGNGTTPLVDVLYDTTDSDLNQDAFAHVVYDPSVLKWAKVVAGLTSMGTEIVAF